MKSVGGFEPGKQQGASQWTNVIKVFEQGK